FYNDIQPVLFGCEPDLVQHMQLELTFYDNLMNGRLTPLDELQFWLQEHKSAIEYVRCNLPPESPLQLQLSQTILNFDTLPSETPFGTMILRQNYLLGAQQTLQQQNQALNLGLPDDRL